MAKRSQDPTKTTLVRRAFIADATRRFRAVQKAIRAEIVDQDGFGLLSTRPPIEPALLTTNRGRFEFVRSEDKIRAFMTWLRDLQNREILTVTTGTSVTAAGNQAWSNKYIETSYQKGIADAGKKLRGAGVQVGESWLTSAFNRPVHADRLGLIFTRVYSELEGITADMDRRIARTLAQGIGDGLGARDLARELSQQVNVGITRARVLARTEVIASHADATLNSYEEAGVVGVQVESEFSTAGDDKVCKECERLEGRIYTLEEARGVIPVHPNCRCAWLPHIPKQDAIRLNRQWRRAA